jgi:DNA-binding beta-propeller fold protein YncE
MKKLLALTLVFVLAGCQSGAAQVSGRSAVDLTGTTKVVVANQQSASASILRDDGVTMAHVHVGAGPHEAAVSPDGRTAVVTIYGVQGAPGNQLAVIDLTRDSVVRTIDLGSYTRPHGVVFLGSSNTRIAVTSEATNNVVVVDVATGSIEAVPTNARGSHMVAVNADGTRGWTANITDNSVSELDLAGRRFVRSFDGLPARPEGVAVTPDGRQVWVGSNETGAVTVISTETGAVTHTLTGSRFPYRLASSPDGARMVIVDAMANRLRIADTRTHEWLGDIEIDGPRGAVVAADNRTAWVTQAGGFVAEVDILEMRVKRALAVQASPDGVGVGLRR